MISYGIAPKYTHNVSRSKIYSHTD